MTFFLEGLALQCLTEACCCYARAVHMTTEPGSPTKSIEVVINPSRNALGAVTWTFTFVSSILEV